MSNRKSFLKNVSNISQLEVSNNFFENVNPQLISSIYPQILSHRRTIENEVTELDEHGGLAERVNFGNTSLWENEREQRKIFAVKNNHLSVNG